ncbi:MAG: YfhO family protein [Candidatus Hydrogenedentes bacterium]|nr:YfhO family protein [Candidatus Hydrogenedentota bacterium]
MTDAEANPHQTERSAGEARLALLASALGLLFAAALFYPLMRGNLYLGSDLGAYHLPVRAFYSHCLKEGLSFLWWPDQFCGYYIHGEGQGGMLHPLHLLLYRALPLDWAFNLEFVSGYLIAYGGMAALLRRWSLPWYAALFGANGFAFSGFTLIHFMHMQAIAIIGHLPWMLLAADVLLKSDDGRALRKAWAALALLAASQLLLGYPQYVLFTLLALGLYTLAHLRTAGITRRILMLALALLVGLLVAGIQIVPTFDVLQTALRQDNAEAWRSGSLHPLNLLQWIGPYWFENRMGYGVPAHEYGLYTGTVPVLLGLWLLIQAPGGSGRQRGLAILLGAQVVLALVLGLGEYGGLYALLAKLPVVGSFRCSARHIVLIHFSLAAMAALAATRLTQDRDTGKRGVLSITIAVAVGWAALALVLVLRATGPAEFSEAFTRDIRWLLAGPLLMSLVAALLYYATRRPASGLVALMVVAMLDIGFYGLPFVSNHTPRSSSLSALELAIGPELPADFNPAQSQEFRAHGNWRVARLTQLGLPNYLGYVGLPPAWELDPNADVTRRLAGVRWEKRPLHATAWTVHADALPRARFVSESRVGEPAQVLSGQIDIASIAITEHALALEAGEPGTVSWRRDNPGDVAFATQTNTAQLLIFSERYHPGWRAAIDGSSVPLERVYGDFMGCVVPPGHHAVTFEFAPFSLRLGGGLSAVGLLLLAAGCFVLGRMEPIGSRRSNRS